MVPAQPLAPRLRKLGFSLLTAGVVLQVVELGCAWVEPRIRPPAAVVPAPHPGREPEFLEAAEVAGRGLRGIPMVEDEQTGWALPPAQIVMSGNVACRINALGIRGADLGPRTDDEARLLTLGDSSVFGDGVAEQRVFSSVAAAKLSAAWHRPVTGIIGGVPGQDSSQSLARLREKGTAIEPTWVVIANMWSEVYKDDGKLRTSASVEVVRTPLRAWATYRVARELLAPWLRRKQVGWIDAMDRDVGGQDAQGRARVTLREYMDNLRALADVSAGLGARPVFLALPAPIDLDPAGAPEDVLQYREAMRRVAAEKGAPFVDAPAWFVSHGALIGHFADQVHPNAYGHAMIGDALADALSELGRP
jgi:lysophospholipase L1-like esterase